MTRVEDQLWRQEQGYYYGGGCQMEPDESFLITCECGHKCEVEEAHEVYGDSMCPSCYQKYIDELKLRYQLALKKEFSEEELRIMYVEDILEAY